MLFLTTALGFLDHVLVPSVYAYLYLTTPAYYTMMVNCMCVSRQGYLPLNTCLCKARPLCNI
ncbi:hypothetical protein PENSPDRAFT_657497 [Peniophora sp. CONT]|nr:hypothetical protein PENSPDRAFT_657497 [Peniophora sp. CONT]